MALRTPDSLDTNVRRNKHGQRLCIHNRVQAVCRECGGSQICEHGGQRTHCRACGGGGICEHGRIRYKCSACGGSGICKHGRQSESCKACGGSQICEHNRIRSYCKECCPIGAYTNYRRGAQRRHHKFEISFAEYQALVCQPCTYCGAHDETNGIDQCVAGEGYTIANCVSCCTKCNLMKLDKPIEEFLGHIKQIAKFQEAKSD